METQPVLKSLKSREIGNMIWKQIIPIIALFLSVNVFGQYDSGKFERDVTNLWENIRNGRLPQYNIIFPKSSNVTTNNNSNNDYDSSNEYSDKDWQNDAEGQAEQTMQVLMNNRNEEYAAEQKRLSEVNRDIFQKKNNMPDKNNQVVHTEDKDDVKKVLEKFDTQLKYLKNLFEKDTTLKPNEIKNVRDIIEKIKDNNLKKEFYKKLQKNVEYKNQRAAKVDRPQSACYITALSEVLAYLGIAKNPEDLDKYCKEKELNPEAHPTRKLLADAFNIKSEPRYLYHSVKDEKGKPLKNKDGKDSITEKENVGSAAEQMMTNIENGNAVLMSVGEHVVRVIDIEYDENKNPKTFIVNDPYGKDMDLDARYNYLTIGKVKISEIDKKINDMKKNPLNLDNEKLETLEKERAKLANNGYGCLWNQTCENANTADENKGKSTQISIEKLKESGLRFTMMYEIYSLPDKK